MRLIGDRCYLPDVPEVVSRYLALRLLNCGAASVSPDEAQWGAGDFLVACAELPADELRRWTETIEGICDSLGVTELA